MPKEGWTAGFIELTYDVEGADPLKFTTEVNIVPQTKPYAEKAPNQTTWVTVSCDVPDEAAAEEMVVMAWPLACCRPEAGHLGVFNTPRWTSFHVPLETRS